MLSRGDEGSKEEEKLGERKVYSRKSFKGLKNNKTSSNSTREPPKALAVVPEGLNSLKRLGNSSFDAGSDNFSGLNRDGLPGKGGVLRQEDRVWISLSIKSKSEALELRRKLEGERDMIRSLMRKIEANEGEKDSRAYGISGGNKVTEGVGPTNTSKPLKQLSVSVIENSKGGSESVEKEKRTPKANQMYRNSEFLLAKDKFPPPENNKKLMSSGKKGGTSDTGHKSVSAKFPKQILKSCNALLERLMKHKHGWVFNTPVDAAGLGLHDYFEIIKKPMDLGTVKTRLNQSWYKSPVEFAEDVRLTFQNAMTYNPKEQDVYVMAEQLAQLFEDKWVLIEADYMRELKLAVDFDVGSPAPIPRKASQQSKLAPDKKRTLDRSESITYSAEPKRKRVNAAQSGKVTTPKKPKAKDPNKREMTYDEKQKLSINLQSLPSEKLENVVHIIRKRNPSVSQQDDEIEVDIDCVDTETLWELDRFITNYKKSLSKNKRQAESLNQSIAGPERNTQEKIPASVVTETLKESRKDEKKVATPPAQLEELGGNDKNQGASSSSASSGSSSSDSDGKSSSGSDSGRSPTE
ncbi:transcription factor GTE4-like [Primulina huaijiensis]|uniref:transcription factor GTE4-like n=1 Tax=Primulina huaijiensis TaxID=1492673 RepID=UPI003CC79512